MVLVLVAGLGLAGCNKPAMEPSSGDMGAGQAEQNQAQTTEPSGVAEWVAGLLAGKAYECEYSAPIPARSADSVAGGPARSADSVAGGPARSADSVAGGAGAGSGGTATNIAEGDRYRSEVETTEGTFISVFDGETSYSWVAGETEGMKMSHDCMTEFSGNMPEVEEGETAMNETFETPEEALNMIPDISCRETSSANFSIPGDVEFVDQCEVLQAQMQMMEQYQDQIPADVMQMMEGMGQ